jgi:hypothetical protein
MKNLYIVTVFVLIAMILGCSNSSVTAPSSPSSPLNNERMDTDVPRIPDIDLEYLLPTGEIIPASDMLNSDTIGKFETDRLRTAQFIPCSDMTADEFRIWFGSEMLYNLFPSHPEYQQIIYCGGDFNGDGFPDIRYRCSPSDEWQPGGVKASLEDCWTDEFAEAIGAVFCLTQPGLLPASFEDWDRVEIPCP